MNDKPSTVVDIMPRLEIKLREATSLLALLAIADTDKHDEYGGIGDEIHQVVAGIAYRIVNEVWDALLKHYSTSGGES